MSGPSTRPCGPVTCTSSKRPWRSCTQCSLRVRHMTRPTDGISDRIDRQSAASGVAVVPMPSRHQLGLADAQRRRRHRGCAAWAARRAGGSSGPQGRHWRTRAWDSPLSDYLAQMKTNRDLDPGRDRPAIARGRQEMPALHGRDGGAVEHLEAARPVQHDLDGRALRIEAHAHQDFALLVELDGARRVDGWRRRMTIARLAFPDDGRRRQETRGGLLGGAGTAEILRRRGLRRGLGCRLLLLLLLLRLGRRRRLGRFDRLSIRRSRRAAARARARARSASASRGRPAAAPRPAGPRSRRRLAGSLASVLSDGGPTSASSTSRAGSSEPMLPAAPAAKRRRTAAPCSASDNAIGTRGARAPYFEGGRRQSLGREGRRDCRSVTRTYHRAVRLTPK